MSLLSSTQQHAERFGLNLLGLVDAQRFDVCQPRERRSSTLQPGCGTIVLLATAGQAFRHGFLSAQLKRLAPNLPASGLPAVGAPTSGSLPVTNGGMPRAMVPFHKLSHAVEETAMTGVRVVHHQLAQQGHAARLVDARRNLLNFDQLAEAAGIGIVSPVSGLLLHPDYGPWMRVRAALLVAGKPFGEIPDASIAADFRPCCACDKPCVPACPPTAHDGLGNTSLQQCGSHRHGGGCGTGCHSRTACPLGAEHRDPDAIPVHAHSANLRTVQRWFGFGVWRIVPRVFRRPPRA